MKKIITSLFTLAFVLVSVKSFTYRSGVSGGYTNGPSESNCTSCHTGTSLNGGSGSLSDLVLTSKMTSGYLKDSTYTMTLKYKQSSISRFGFSITALVAKDDSPAGDFTVTSNRTQKSTKGVSGKTRQYIGHTSTGTATTSSNATEWEFEWKAPSTNVGAVKFYAVVNATNGNNGNSGDQVYAKVFEFKYAGMPVATADAKDTAVCAGETVSLIGSGTNSPTSYSWEFPDGTPSVSTKQNPTTSYSGFGKKYAILKVENKEGWSEPDTQIIQVAQAPFAQINGSSSYTICPGDSVQLTAAYNPKYSYQWSTGGTSNTTYVKKAGDVYVTVKSGDCSKVSNIVTIKQHSVSAPKITASNTADSICHLDVVTLTANTGYDSLVWYNNTMELDKSTSNTYVINVDTNSLYTAKGWDANGCLSDASNGISYVVIERDEAPKVTCTNRGPFTLTYDWAGISSHNGVQVSEDKGKSWKTPSSGTTGNTHTLSGLDPEENYEVWVRALTKSPCFYGTVTKQVCMTGKCSPLDITMDVDTSICKGDEVTIEINGLTGESYSIAFEGGGQFTDTIFQFSPQNEGNYTLLVTDSNSLGCPPKKLVFPIHISEISDLKFRTNKPNHTFCTGDTIKFTATSGNDLYKFYVNNQLKATETDSFYFEAQFADGDSAYVEVQKGACEAKSENIYLTVVPLPDPGFTYTRDGKDYTFTPDNENYKAYFWEFGDGFTSVLMKPEHDYTTSANKTVTAELMVTDNSDCVAESSQSIEIPNLSSVELMQIHGIKLFPSPAKDELHVQWNNPNKLPTSVVIYTTDLQNVAMFTNESNDFTIDLTNIAVGLYIIEIQRDDIVVRQRLIKN